jgi:ectoine hydroxylase-related dioxygenase (phytanoyl-CoA dioxygenase family)
VAQAQEFRVDVPFDERNFHSWHQEQTYIHANYLGENCLGYWLPLNHHKKDMGALEVIPGSHRLNSLKVFSKKWSIAKHNLLAEADKSNIQKPSQFSTSGQTLAEELSLPESLINELSKNKIAVDMKPGDVLFFHMLLLHQSGANTSEQIRFTAANRINVSSSEDFRPFRSRVQYSPC